MEAKENNLPKEIMDNDKSGHNSSSIASQNSIKLPQDIVDKITNKAMEMFPKHPNKKSPVYVDTFYQEKQQAYILGGWFAALHYSQIIEQKDNTIKTFTDTIVGYSEEIVRQSSEIQQLKAENERLKELVKLNEALLKNCDKGFESISGFLFSHRVQFPKDVVENGKRLSRAIENLKNINNE